MQQTARYDYRSFWTTLAPICGEGEAKAVARLVMEEVFGLTMTDILCGRDAMLSDNQQQCLSTIVGRLRNNEPVQYVLGWADFGGNRFCVTPDVLIPRPETVGLCDWVVELAEKNLLPTDGADILDIGTGSGCIACSIAKQLPTAHVSACDISPKALSVARGNAEALNADVSFFEQDALSMPADKERWDCIVSNPPYICDSEASDMEKRVKDHEPHIALFVPDSNPLLFYSAIARYAASALRPGGWLLFEINPRFVGEMRKMLSEISEFSDILLRPDIFDKNRFMACRKR